MPPQGSAQFENKNIVLFSQFDGMNTQSDRHDLDEKKAAWMENLQPIGPNNALCVPAPAAAKTTIIGETITEEFFAPINAVDYLVCFCDSGAAYAVNLAGGAQTKFANAGTFSAAPDMTVWNRSRVLIADPVSGYATWDGTVFVAYGGVSPNIEVTAGGSGYTAPVVAISGGTGTGATATAQETGGVITGITLTDAGTGYLAGDTLTVTITDGGGGSGATASAHVWPNIPSVTTLAVFQGRVWLAALNVITYTGTGASFGGVGYDDFLSGDASGSFTVNDADLVHAITALRSLNNYLFVIGDASVKQIGSLSVSGSTTGFTLVTLSSDQGTAFRNTVISYNRLVLFANTVGVYAIFGTSVEKISDDMDGIFRLIDFSQAPSAAVNDINNIHCFLLLVKYKEPVLGPRSLILTFMNKKWFVISQGAQTFIATVSIGGVTETFSTAGADVTQLLEDAASPVSIKLQSSLTSHGAPWMGKNMVRYAIAQKVTEDNDLQLTLESERMNQVIPFTVANSLNFVNNAGGGITFTGTGGDAINFFSETSVFAYVTGNSGGISGIYLGATLTGSVIGYSFNSMMFEVGEAAAFGNLAVSVGPG